MIQNKLLTKLIQYMMIPGIIVMFIMIMFPSLFETFELKTQDFKFKARRILNEEPEMSSNVSLVLIDDYSKESSGLVFWPYSYYQQTIEKISEGNPEIVGADFFFTEDCDSSGLGSFITAMDNIMNVVHPYVIDTGPTSEMIDKKKYQDFINLISADNPPEIKSGYIPHVIAVPYQNSTQIQDVSYYGMGYVNIDSDIDGIVRSVPIVSELDGKLILHFSFKLFVESIGYDINNIELSASKIVLNRFPLSNGEMTRVVIPLDYKGHLIINYVSDQSIQTQIENNQFKSYSSWDVKNAKGKVDFKNDIVIFGDISATSKDYSNTPIDNTIGNPVIFANIISNLMYQDFITPYYNTSAILIFLIIIALFIVLANFYKVLHFSILSGFVITLYFILDVFAFVYGSIQLPTTYILYPIAYSYFCGVWFLMYQNKLEMDTLEGSLQSYLSPTLMAKIKDNPDMLKLGGERKRITVLFSDIVGFTSFCDEVDPAEVQEVLEDYFADMADIVFKNGGIIDKYMGDGILVFFENEKDSVSSPHNGIKCATQMQKRAVELDKKYKDQKRLPFSIRVSLATGYAKVGNIGPKEKVDYTIIGSVVNKGARLEHFGNAGDIIIDDETYVFVKEDYKTEDLGENKLKGFEKPIQVYKIL